MTDSGQSKVCPADRTVLALAGGVLILIGRRYKRPWRILLTVLGADLVRRAIAGLRATHQAQLEMDRKLDEMSMQSFPASDPPAY